MNKQERYVEYIINDLVEQLQRFAVPMHSDVNYYLRKVEDILTNQHNITDSKVVDKLTNLYLSRVLYLPKIGSRIELVSTDDPYTSLKPGDSGEVEGYRPTPWGWQLAVKWDNGSGLQLIPNEDFWKVLS